MATRSSELASAVPVNRSMRRGLVDAFVVGFILLLALLVAALG